MIQYKKGVIISQRTTYSKEFKDKMIQLHESGMSRKDILIEYNIKPQTFDRWLKAYRRPSNTEKPEISLTDEQKRIAELERELRSVKIERDILKDAALILGKR